MDLFRNEEIEYFVDRLSQLTGSGALSWAVGERPSSFKATLPRFQVRVWSLDADDLPPFGFEITSKAGGERLASLSSQDSTQLSSILQGLFNTAARSALNLDEVVSQFQEDLDSLEPPPF